MREAPPPTRRSNDPETLCKREIYGLRRSSASNLNAVGRQEASSCGSPTCRALRPATGEPPAPRSERGPQCVRVNTSEKDVALDVESLGFMSYQTSACVSCSADTPSAGP